MTKITILITLCFCIGSLNLCFAQNQPDVLQIAIRSFVSNEIRGMKEFKKSEVITHDSFTQKSWLLFEIKQNLADALEQINKSKAYSNLAQSKLNQIKKLKQQKKSIGNIGVQLEEATESATMAFSEFEGFMKIVNNKSELALMADSTTIIKRIVIAKIIYTAHDDTLVLQKYKIEFGKNYALVLGRREDD